jgi:hypothetical protein
MAEGSNSFMGLALPLTGNSEITAKDDTYDIVTITGYSTNQAGDFIVAQTSAGTEKFVVDASGNVTAAGTLAVTGAVNLTAKIASQLGLGTVAISSLASNASTTIALSGLTTKMVVQIFQTSNVTTPMPVVWVSAADKIGVAAPSVDAPADTYVYWAFATTA